MTRRKAIGLVETVMAMSIAVAVMGLLAVTVARLIKSSSQSHEHLQTVVTLGRLGEQFRLDVHASTSATTSATVGENKQATRLTLAGDAGQAVTYDIVPGGIERVATAPGQPERRERFALAGMKCIGWNVDAGGREVSLVVGRLTRPDVESEDVHGQFRLSAHFRRPVAVAANP